MNSLNLPKRLTINQNIILMIALFIVLFISGELILHKVLIEKTSQNLDIQLEQSTHRLNNTIDRILLNLTNSIFTDRAGEALLNMDIINSRYHDDPEQLEAQKEIIKNLIKDRPIGNSGFYILWEGDKQIIEKPLPTGFNPSQFLDDTDNISYKKMTLDIDGESSEVFISGYYFAPWDWTVLMFMDFGDKLDLIDLKNVINLKNDLYGIEQGYSFIVNAQGEYLAHPYLFGEYISDDDKNQEWADLFNTVILNKESGIADFNFYDKRKNGELVKKRLHYTWAEDGDWIIATAIPESELDSHIETFRNALLPTLSLLLILISLMIYYFLFSFSKPIKNLIKTIKSELPEQNKNRAWIKNETFSLCEYYDSYQNRLKIASDENNTLARFPNNLPDPVIRTNKKGERLYLNLATKKLINSLPLQEQKQMRADIKSFILSNDMSKTSTTTLKWHQQIYNVTVVSIPEKEEFFLHFQEKTFEKQFHALTSVSNELLEKTRDAVLTLNESGHFIEINNGFTKITGYSDNEIIARSIEILDSGTGEKHLNFPSFKNLKTDEQWSEEIWMRRSNGEIFLSNLEIKAFEDVFTAETKYLGLFQDISAQMKIENQLNSIIDYDPLTGLPNQNRFEIVLNTKIKVNRDNLTLIMLKENSLNSMSNLIDMQKSQEILKKASCIVARNFSTLGNLFILNNDFFGIILDEKVKLSDREVDKLITRIQHESSDLNLEFKAGISSYPADCQNAEGLIKSTLAAFSRCQLTPQSLIERYDEKRDSVQIRLTALKKDLLSALENNEFFLVYQPQIDLKNDKIIGYESLIRWKRRNEEFISPMDFIPLAEESGMIIPLGLWIFEEACRFSIKLKEQGFIEEKTGINISIEQMRDPNFFENIIQITERYNIHPSRLDLEITESMEPGDIEQVAYLTEKLKSRGFSISIDDFGTGYSSLSYLSTLSFNKIKIDKSFVDKMLMNSNSRSIINSIISLGKSLGKTIIAEGIETLEQKEYLIKEGCDQIQGYHYSPPLTEDKIFENKNIN